MKMITRIIGIVLAAGVVMYLQGCGNNSQTTSATGAEQDSSRPKEFKTKENAFKELRDIAFSTTPERLELSLPAEHTVVYGVIMDWGIDTSTAMTVAYKTGDASIYTSSGFAVIGGGQHENVSTAAKQFVNLAQTYLHKTARAQTTALPGNDTVNFYLLTNKGTFAGQEIMKNFENKSSEWLPLFDEGNKVLTELREVSSKAKSH